MSPKATLMIHVRKDTKITSKSHHTDRDYVTLHLDDDITLFLCPDEVERIKNALDNPVPARQHRSSRKRVSA